MKKKNLATEQLKKKRAREVDYYHRVLKKRGSNWKIKRYDNNLIVKNYSNKTTRQIILIVEKKKLRPEMQLIFDDPNVVGLELEIKKVIKK